MVNIILHGCNGAMGRVISELVQEEEDFNIAAGIDISEGKGQSYPVYTDAGQCNESADAVVDFSVAAAVDGIIDYAVKRSLPLVLCTTGLSDEQLEKVREASEKIPVLRSANMSLGVNTLFKLVSEAARILADRGFDIEIVEKHHHRKLDAPSGTAIAIADAANEAAGGKYEYIFDRSGRRSPRDPKEIGISSVRGGNIVGEHEVLFCGTDEVIEIKHTAYSRAIFAKGALSAAAFLKGKRHGLYQMSDVIG